MKRFDTLDLSPEVAASAFAALGSEQRLAVLRALVRAGDAGISIGELGKRVGIGGSTLTHHMKILTQAGLARRVKDGRRVICVAVSYDELRRLSDFLIQECCADEACRTGHDD